MSSSGEGAFDVAIVGLGAVGSAAAYELSHRGLRVLGLDRHRPPHSFGSSSGGSRILRQAYFEDPRYVPLIQEAQAHWRELEARLDARLFLETGGLMVGPEQGELVAGARSSAELHGLAYEMLDAREVERRFPALRPPAEMVGLWEPHAGVLFPETAIELFLTHAAARGARICLEETVSGWTDDGHGVRLETSRGCYRAGRLLLCAGPWVGELLDGVELTLEVERQVQHFFAPGDSAHFVPDACPIHIWEYKPGRFWYGLPDLGEGVKLAIHRQGAVTTAGAVDRDVKPAEVDALLRLVGPALGAALGPWLSSRVCLYTNTPDHHFVVDHHPEHPRVLIASACSGHGFKFSSLVGRHLADLVLEAPTALDLDLFRLARFADP